ncbi:hypothetical protein HYV81_03070 [Candidatus Woesearchaeota archaeon]|nr:hypothetical protein [Candidatus Woesearchaeota archaeon]
MKPQNSENFGSRKSKDFLGTKESKETLNPELYKILACPVCKSDVKYTSDMKALKCVKCSKTYPIRDGIPVMMA